MAVIACASATNPCQEATCTGECVFRSRARGTSCVRAGGEPGFCDGLQNGPGCIECVDDGGCGDDGLLPTTVEPGADFVQEDVVFDDEFFYCRVEPGLFKPGCGSGVAGTDPANSCHFFVTKFRLSDYMPRVSDKCNVDSLVPRAVVTSAAQLN